MSVAIATDSNSGITQKQGEDLGISILPMPFMINGQTYYEDINIGHQEFYEKMVQGCEISTSQPSPDSVMELWDKLLMNHDQVVYIPMSASLSGSCQTAAALSREPEYEGRVYVTDNRRISVTLRQSVLDAKTMADKGLTAEEIRKVLEDTKSDSSIYITVDTLHYLKKGGRITPAAAALGTLLRIKPILTIQGGKLDACSKARTMKQAKATMVSAITRDMEARFAHKDGENLHLQVAYTDNEAAALEFKKELEEIYPGVMDIYVDALSFNISCHIGPGALAIACTKALRI